MTKVGLVMVVTMAAIGLSACAVENEASVRSDAPAETPASQSPTLAPSSGDAILIETRITDAKLHAGEVLAGSVIGESAFCPGGESSGSSQGPTITTTFSCPDGTLTVQYAPTQRSLVQSAEWVVVKGTAEVTIGEEIRTIHENESVYIPIGSKHRLANPGKIPLELIEVQVGSYLGEDDIQRLDDVYGRG